MIKYSWILPIKDEARVLPQLLSEIRRAMKGESYEIIAVDDASQKPFAGFASSTSFKSIRFSSHCGKWAALREGIKASLGQIIITSDSDGQDDPKEVKKLLNKLDRGYDLVSGWRRERHDPYYKIIISRIGNFLVSILYRKKFKDLNSPFKVYKKEVLAALPKEGSLLRYSLLFGDKFGFKTDEIPVNHRPRKYGKSKFGVIKYLRILYDLLLVYLLFSGSGRLTRTK